MHLGVLPTFLGTQSAPVSTGCLSPSAGSREGCSESTGVQTAAIDSCQEDGGTAGSSPVVVTGPELGSGELGAQCRGQVSRRRSTKQQDGQAREEFWKHQASPREVEVKRKAPGKFQIEVEKAPGKFQIETKKEVKLIRPRFKNQEKAETSIALSTELFVSAGQCGHGGVSNANREESFAQVEQLGGGVFGRSASSKDGGPPTVIGWRG